MKPLWDHCCNQQFNKIFCFVSSFADSRAFLHGSRDLHVQTGSKLTLSCAVKSSSGYPDYVYWYRNEDVLNYSPHVKIEDAKSPDEQPLVSKLSVENVQRSHTGNYTCAPSNARPASVMVHVVDGKYLLTWLKLFFYHIQGHPNIWKLGGIKSNVPDFS